jgi:hypothetical protein
LREAKTMEKWGAAEGRTEEIGGAHEEARGDEQDRATQADRPSEAAMSMGHGAWHRK